MKTPLPRRRMSGERRRQQLLEQAKCLFGKLGYRNASTSQLAQHSGISEPVLYQHFDSKKHLFIETLQAYGRNNELALRQAMAADGDLRAVDALAGMLIHYRRIMSVDPDISRLIFDGFSEARDPDIAQAVHENLNLFRGHVLRLLTWAQEQGDIAAEVDLATASMAFIGILCTTQAFLMLGIEQELDEVRIRDYTRLWLRALAPQQI